MATSTFAPAAITVDGVSKRFRLYRERPTSLKERIVRFRLHAEELWALHDVSFDVPQGQTLGLIGPNGSGKTTLLKVIAGILRPTEGRVVTRGRIAELLALAAGFHPELTGRENVYLNASILGLTRRETDRLFDDIIGFAELEDFVDNQVKFYSSGMYVRLGFAVAVHVDPAVLLVDEVLAVGDIAFQRKCLDKVEAFRREGRTIVFVTHAPDLVIRICDRVVLLNKGQIVGEGAPRDVVRDFRRLMARQDVAYGWDEGTKEIEIVSAAIFGADGVGSDTFSPGDEMVIQMDLRATTPVEDPVISFALHDENNNFVFGTNSDWRQVRIPVFQGKYRLQFILKSLPFVEGRYFVTLGVHSRDSRRVFHLQEQRYSFHVTKGEENPGAVFIPVECRIEPL
jgi:ABC-2 type transport system ATP-binding protein